MTLIARDSQHFYIDEQLIDLVWIGHRIRQQTNAANYHEMQRHVRWLNKLATRLLSGNIDAQDEGRVKKRLIALGLGWYFDKNAK